MLNSKSLHWLIEKCLALTEKIDEQKPAIKSSHLKTPCGISSLHPGSVFPSLRGEDLCSAAWRKYVPDDKTPLSDIYIYIYEVV